MLPAAGGMPAAGVMSSVAQETKKNKEIEKD
jgi:hypothetical protein